jgi:acetylornithine/succinyldiaminopimelate/putrescine aminotransferase
LKDKYKGFYKGLRRLGLMMGLEFEQPEAGPVFTKTAFDNDLLMVYANNDTRVVQFLPQLTISDTDIDMFVPAIDRAMAEARKLLPVLRLKRSVQKLFSRKDKE